MRVIPGMKGTALKLQNRFSQSHILTVYFMYVKTMALYNIFLPLKKYSLARKQIKGHTVVEHTSDSWIDH